MHIKNATAFSINWEKSDKIAKISRGHCCWRAGERSFRSDWRAVVHTKIFVICVATKLGLLYNHARQQSDSISVLHTDSIKLKQLAFNISKFLVAK